MPTKRKKPIISIITIILASALFLSGILYYNNQTTKTKEFKQRLSLSSPNIPDKREYPINKEIEPCANFYKYSCSSVMKDFKLREDRFIHIFAFDDAIERLLEAKKKYFLTLARKKPKNAMEDEIKNYYLACMNKEARKDEEIAMVEKTKQFLKKIKTKKEFLNLIAKNIADPSQLSFIDFNTGISNLDRPNYNDLFFDIGLTTLPEKSYYEEEEVTAALKNLIQQFFMSIGENHSEQKANWVLSFEKRLAKKYPSSLEFRERTYSQNEISRKKLIENYPYLKLEKFLSKIPEHVVIQNIMGDEAMKFLDKALKSSSLDELKSIYLYFQLSPFMDDAYPKFFEQKVAFNHKYLGKPSKMPSRQERCTMTVMYKFEKEVDYILSPKLFPDFPKEKVVKLVKKVQGALLEQLQDNSWLDTSTKREAIKKIKNAKLLLVSPNNEEEWNFNPRTSYSNTAPIANSQKLTKLLANKELKELKGPINTNRWHMGPLAVNASYNTGYNQLIIPIGILQHPFYDPSEPDQVNLGAIGSIIGHELGHAIDNNGSNFDDSGVFVQWMSPKDKKIFNEKTRRLIDQFNKVGHNGKLTLPENISDLVGLSAAYKAAFPKTNSGDKELRKRFFLQFARTACEIQREKLVKLRLKTDPHSLGYAMVNEQLKHQAGFREAYSCKPTDPLVISEKEIVKVW